MSLSLSAGRDAIAAIAAGADRAHGAAVSGGPAFHVVRRSGHASSVGASKTAVAFAEPFEGGGAAASRRAREMVERRANAGRALHIEDIQDHVELAPGQAARFHASETGDAEAAGDAADRAASECRPMDDVVGWMFFGFSRPRKWAVGVCDFQDAIDAFDAAVPEGVKVMKHEPILRSEASGYAMTPGEVVEQTASLRDARDRKGMR